MRKKPQLTTRNVQRPALDVRCWALISVCFALLHVLPLSNLLADTHYVWTNSPTPTSPYTNWARAAHDIQSAVNASANGDTVLVTNGTYETGSVVVYGAMQNRVAINKAIKLRSVSGPDVTIIKGQKALGGGNGNGAVRCAYLTSGAQLAGFTLTNGATVVAGDEVYELSGGGVWCEDMSALITNCVIVGNSAASWGGGADWGTFFNCTFVGNTAQSLGGGAEHCDLNSCIVSGNSAESWGGGTYEGRLNNCTLTKNWAGFSGGGSWGSTQINCIVYYNTAGIRGPNYYGGLLSHCCTTPMPTGGIGNMTNEPLIACVGMPHLLSQSPCRDAGTYQAWMSKGIDMDGEARLNGMADIGPDEYWANAVTGGMKVAFRSDYTNAVEGYAVRFSAEVGGWASGLEWSFGDGVKATNLCEVSHSYKAAGYYQVILTASNASGSSCVTGAVRIAAGAAHYVSPSGSHVSPFASWATAATNIQSAVDAATIPGALVWVTNGLYAHGGRAVFGSMTNRVVISKPVIVRSVNGPAVTFIAGRGVSPGGTNCGDGAIRCAFVGRGGALQGFTLTNGHTRATPGLGHTGLGQQESGGGVWCELGSSLSNCFIIANSAAYEGGGTFGGELYGCTLTGNFAEDTGGGAGWCTLYDCTLSGNTAYTGGGAYKSTVHRSAFVSNSADWGGGACDCDLSGCQISGNSATDGGGVSWGTLRNCVVSGNSARRGGGVDDAVLYNCTLTGNSAVWSGGGARYGTLYNCMLSGNSSSYEGGGTYETENYSCTLVGNIAMDRGGGSHLGSLENCIIYYNEAPVDANSYSGTLARCCTTPLPHGEGNISAEPLLTGLSSPRLLPRSPCIDAGTNRSWMAGSTDLYGHPRIHPFGGVVDIGAYEYVAGGQTNSLTVACAVNVARAAAGFEFTFTSDIRGECLGFTWSWGDGQATQDLVVARHAFVTPGDYVVTLWASNLTMTATATVSVCVLSSPPHYVSPVGGHVYPFTNWVTAATNIQSAIDACAAGGVVLVTNGVYEQAGAVCKGALTNRVALTKPILVRSINGPNVTFIKGSQVPGTTTGEGAVRCVYMTSGATLSGFTLTGGATRTAIEANDYEGGGAWCEGAGAVISNCILTGNAAYWGGGVRGGSLFNCVLTGNSAKSCGGAYKSTLFSCSITGNSAVQSGGGVGECALCNCIAYFNRAPNDANHFDSSFIHSCTTPINSGGGNLAVEPLITGVFDPRLLPQSPCVDAGTNQSWMARSTDLHGHPRIQPSGGVVDIGAYEYVAGSQTGPLQAACGVDIIRAATDFEFTFTADIKGECLGFTWSWGDGYATQDLSVARHAYTAPGDYVVALFASNLTMSVTAVVTVQVVNATTTYHVSPMGGHVAPFSNWATAATNLQAAIEEAAAGCVVLVTNGIYRRGGAVAFGLLTNRVAIIKPLTVRSVNGPGVTLIEGSRVPVTTNGASAVRCVYMVSGVSLLGFTLTNGATRATGESYEREGGGVWCEGEGAIISNCVISGNAAYSGGGVRGGKLHSCILNGNSATSGGGARASTLHDCTVTGNSAGFDGGGVSNCELYNCYVAGNRAGSLGGGSIWGVLRNSLLTGNSAFVGGGMLYGTLQNCTVVGNTASLYGGGVADGNLRNCIVYYNSAPSGMNYEGGTWAYSCTMPAPDGNGVTTNAPQFISLPAANLRLRANSPCVDKGVLQDWMQSALDKDGYPRILNGRVDMGAYEFHFDLSLRCLLQGPYGADSHAMGAGLAPYLPVTSPYAIDRQTLSRLPTNAVDWLLVQVRSANTNTPVFARSEFIRNDGVVMDTSGSTTLLVEVSPMTTNYLVVSHRNHLAVVSAFPVAFTNTAVSYDFTTGPDKYVGGTNACVELEPGVWGLIAGDADGDGKITPTDRKIVERQKGMTGYLQGDLNLDGKVDGCD